MTNPPAIVATAPMSATECVELNRHEQIIDRAGGAFYQAGQSLKAIRDNQYFRAQCRSFEQYCQSRFDMDKTYASRLITASDVVVKLTMMGFTRLPANEGQARQLVGLDPEQLKSVWQNVIDRAKNQRITAALIAEVVVHSTEDKPVITDGMTPEFRAVFEALSPDDQARYLQNAEEAARKANQADDAKLAAAKAKTGIEKLSDRLNAAIKEAEKLSATRTLRRLQRARDDDLPEDTASLLVGGTG